MKSTTGKAKQVKFPLPPAAELANHFASVSREARGAVFTRREVVEFILDLAGYTANRPLYKFRLLEPSFGAGDFLLPAVERLMKACRRGRSPGSRRAVAPKDLVDAIRAVEVDSSSILDARAKLLDVLQANEISRHDAHRLIQSWIIEGDFLLADLPHSFTHAVGNPPYVRQELIPDALLAEYRARYRTIYDRADLYVPFMERCLTALELGGTSAFICADRWMKNKYGGPLRELVAGEYHLAHYVDMVDTPAFHAEVTAYPAITVFRRDRPGPTRIAHRPKINYKSLAQLARTMRAKTLPENDLVIEADNVAQNREPWILRSFDQLAVVRRLEADYPLLEDADCKVGIGVATGADRIYIGPFESLDVEPDRKLPLVKTRDIKNGNVQWQGLGVINPFADDGSLVDLADYPRLARYFEKHADSIRKRNCAKRNPNSWYRTIDRIDVELTHRPKLLIPDIKGEAHAVYEDGQLYPHHNLYFITSDEWDLKALQSVLRSDITKLFVSMYSTEMRGGYLRFQAQYLRRIRLPRWQEVGRSIRNALRRAAGADVQACNRAAFSLYRLVPGERTAIERNPTGAADWT